MAANVSAVRRLSDGVLFQAVLTGSLSFSHIHDLAAAHGQDGWKAWCYPLSVDLLTVAAYRKLNTARHTDTATGVAWCSFLLGLAASLAANIAAAWHTPDRPTAVALGLWPAVAFLFCTLLGHSAPAESVEVEADTAPVVHAVAERTTATPTPAAVQTPPVAALPPAEPPTSAPAPAVPVPNVSPDLLAYARRLAEDYQRQHQTPISLAALRHRLGVAPALAQTVHAHLIGQGA